MPKPLPPTNLSRAIIVIHSLCCLEAHGNPRVVQLTPRVNNYGQRDSIANMRGTLKRAATYFPQAIISIKYRKGIFYLSAEHPYPLYMKAQPVPTLADAGEYEETLSALRSWLADNGYGTKCALGLAAITRSKLSTVKSWLWGARQTPVRICNMLHCIEGLREAGVLRECMRPDVKNWPSELEIAQRFDDLPSVPTDRLLPSIRQHLAATQFSPLNPIPAVAVNHSQAYLGAINTLRNTLLASVGKSRLYSHAATLFGVSPNTAKTWLLGYITLPLTAAMQAERLNLNPQLSRQALRPDASAAQWAHAEKIDTKRAWYLLDGLTVPKPSPRSIGRPRAM
jgi:DNA-binding transcriptional regulator YdaS (Cro superfamily)